MQIELHNVGKHFNKKWVFKNIDYIFYPNSVYGIVGVNGSGKSTLLKLTGNNIDLSEGNIVYKNKESEIKKDIYKYISFATPYHAIIEEFTLNEMLRFHFKFKKIIKNYTLDYIVDISRLDVNANETIATFSTGMKQRIKLLLAFFSDTPIVLLDEPSSNLDNQSVEWMNSLICNYSSNRTIIICSNHNNNELKYCNTIIDINEYKKNL